MHDINANGYTVNFIIESYDQLSTYLSQNTYSKIFILVDTNTNEYCLPYFLESLDIDTSFEIVEIEPGEEQKNIYTCIELWKILNDLGADRKSLLINLGGGVITDMGGFIASTFKRGIDFINIPTTLLAMVDASVGGKNGVDLDNLKNQIGTINSPKMVCIDSVFLETLATEEMRSGLAEMLKHGLIFDAAYWELLKNLKEFESSELTQLIHRSVEIKNEIVSTDLTENGIRKTLNFGHTLGHAIESYFLGIEQNILHGEAVALGMVLESYISFKKNLLTENELDEISSLIFNYFDHINFDEKAINSIIELLVFDKKNEFGKVQFSLLQGIGKCIFNQEVDNQLIKEAFEYLAAQ